SRGVDAVIDDHTFGRDHRLGREPAFELRLPLLALRFPKSMFDLAAGVGLPDRPAADRADPEHDGERRDGDVLDHLDGLILEHELRAAAETMTQLAGFFGNVLFLLSTARARARKDHGRFPESTAATWAAGFGKSSSFSRSTGPAQPICKRNISHSRFMAQLNQGMRWPAGARRRSTRGSAGLL